jgi:hypothetical protein
VDDGLTDGPERMSSRAGAAFGSRIVIKAPTGHKARRAAHNKGGGAQEAKLAHAAITTFKRLHRNKVFIAGGEPKPPMLTDRNPTSSVTSTGDCFS